MINPFKAIKDFFTLEQVKHETYISKIPSNMKEVVKYLDSAIVTENAQIKAQLIQTQEELTQLKKKFENTDDIKKQQEVYKEIYEKYYTQKKLNKNERFIYRFDGKHLPNFLFKNKKRLPNLKKMYGVEVREVGKGYLMWFPVLTDGKEKYTLSKGAYSFEDIFEDVTNLPTQIKSGNIVSNFLVKDNGELTLLGNTFYDEDKNTQVKVVDVSRAKEIEYETIIKELSDTINVLRGRAGDAEKREAKMRGSLAETEVALGVSQSEKEVYAGNLAVVAQKLRDNIKEVMSAMSAYNDAVTSQVLTEKENLNILKKLDEAQGKLNALETSPAREVERAIKKDEFEDMVDVVQKLGEVAAKAKSIKTARKEKTVTPPELIEP